MGWTRPRANGAIRCANAGAHQLPQLLAQRIAGLALGYEDLNDHDQLRRDPLLAVAVGTVRLKLLKVAAQVSVSVRRVYVRLSSAYPWQALFRRCHRRLMACSPASG